MEKTIIIQIKETARFESDLTFTIEIRDPKGFGAKLGRITTAVITITNDEEFKRLMDKFAEIM
jgi:hypothetical protein